MSGRNDGDGEDQIVERLREREDATIVNIWRRTDYEYIEIGRDVQAAIDMGYVAKVGGLKAWIIQKRLKSHTFYFQCLF